jgi:hypothetical protein
MQNTLFIDFFQVFSGVTNTCIISIIFNTRFYQFYTRLSIKMIKTGVVCEEFNIHIWYLSIPTGVSHLKIYFVYFLTKTGGMVTLYMANIKTWAGHVRKLCGMHVGHTCSRPSNDPFLQLANCLHLMNFNGLLTAHPDIIKVLFASLMHNFFIKPVVLLYMFRALLCSSSGGLNCIYASSGSWYHHSP